MTKIYKVSFYAVDVNDEYINRKHFESNLEYSLYDLDVNIDHLEVEESEEFEWDDDLEINKNDASIDVFEEYFK